jgi:hypothetical protein
MKIILKVENNETMNSYILNYTCVHGTNHLFIKINRALIKEDVI